MLQKEFEQYITILDKYDTNMIDKRVEEKGLIECLDKQLVYLDCSRIYDNGMRAMQTIGYPYQRELTTYLYLLDKCSAEIRNEYEEKLISIHKANLEYEQNNPPIWYGGKKAKAEWERKSDKLPRRRKCKEQTFAGFGKELTAEERLKRLSTSFPKLNFKIKLKK